MELLRKIILGIALAIGTLPLIVGIALVWLVAVIPWLVYSIIVEIARLAGVNSARYSLPEFIDACARPLG